MDATMCTTTQTTQQHAHPPQQRRHGMQERGVVVHLLGAQINLHVSEQVADQVTEQHDAGSGHHGFFADRRLIEVDGFVQVAVYCDRTHS